MERKISGLGDRKQFLKDKLEVFSVTLDDRMLQQFSDFYEILIEWNQVMNLTAIVEYEEVVEKHFADSISLADVIDLHHGQTVMDVGTGAGFPGIPLKIIFPDLQITLLDSLNKRIRFLNEVIQRLGLTDIEAIHGRAEDFARKEGYREHFDICVSRAVANLSSLSEYCLPYVRKGGYFIAYKSGEIEEELESSKNAVRLLGGEVEDVIKFSLPGTDISRSFIKIGKIGRQVFRQKSHCNSYNGSSSCENSMATCSKNFPGASRWGRYFVSFMEVISIEGSTVLYSSAVS